jgi:replicative DNA helicase
MKEREAPAGSQIPHDIAAEKAVLATVMYDPNMFDRIAVKLRPDDFFSSSNREVFLAMSELSAEGTVISRMSVAEQLRMNARLEAIGGLPYLADLIEYEGTPASLDFAADTVKRNALKRKLVEAAQEIVKEGLSSQADVDEMLVQAEQRIIELLQEKPDTSAVSLEQIVKDVVDSVKHWLETGTAILGVNTGFKDLDEMTSGFRKGNLVILAARPSMGKTALALNMAVNAALMYQKKVVIFSLEMSREELGFRMLSSQCGVDGRRLRRGQLTERELARFIEAARKLSGVTVTVDDTPALSISDFRNKCRRLKKEGQCDMILVDYLQLMRGTSARARDSREQEIAEISRSLKAVAKELEVPVVALSQLNRALENRKDKRPLLSDLRESGSIEQDADVIIFIHRDEYYEKNSPDKGIAELIIGKQRNGPVGTVKVAFQPDYARFVNLQHGPDDLTPTV